MNTARGWGLIAGLAGLLALSGCDGDDETDAGPPRVDAGGGGSDSGVDAGSPMVDAGPPGHCDAPDLILAGIDPGVAIFIMNPTGAAIDPTTYQLCMRPAYVTLGSLMGAVTSIGAGQIQMYPWPGSFTDTDAGGEVALYTSGLFDNPDQQIDFVCWGTGHSGMSRLSVAEADGDWSGACAGAITGNQLSRIPDTDGTSADSYDGTDSSPPLMCP